MKCDSIICFNYRVTFRRVVNSSLSPDSTSVTLSEPLGAASAFESGVLDSTKAALPVLDVLRDPCCIVKRGTSLPPLQAPHTSDCIRRPIGS